MDQPHEPETDFAPLNVIRTETALSRYPVHRLAKRGDISIEIREQDEQGATTLLWEVTHNSKYGHPGPLAYKLDTLVINRGIEEAGKPVPKIIRLGSLRDICAQVGAGEGNTNKVKKALRQNASAFIVARIDYKGTDGSEKHLEADFTRYSVIFTGEKLPTGRSADAVYIELHDRYREVLTNAIYRPLDYDYMRVISEGAQRFYELVSYQIFAALKYNNRAKLLYSDYCMRAPQTRYFDYDHVKKQMWKIHRPHMESGYIGRVNFQETADSEERPDWEMFYTPGPKAIRDHKTFMETGRVTPQRHPALAKPRREAPAFQQLDFPPDPPEPAAPDTSLVEELVSHGLNRDVAERFAREKPEECRRQLIYLPFAVIKTTKPRWLRSAIQGEYGAPDAYEAAQAAAQARREEQSKAERGKARQSHEEAHHGDYLAYLEIRVGEIEAAHPEAFAAFTAADETLRRGRLKFFTKSERGRKLLEDFDRPQERLLRAAEFFKRHKECPVLSFWEWDHQVNPNPFAADGKTA